MLTDLAGQLRRRRQATRARQLRERAIDYAVHGWTVALLAVPGSAEPRPLGCPCGGTCDEPHLVDGVAYHDPDAVERVWGEHGWDIALVTTHMQVLELPGRYGAPLNRLLREACPTAIAPRPRRWLYFLQPDSVDPDQVAGADGCLQIGPDSWLPAPGTWTELTGRIRWYVHPREANWHPYRPTDPIHTILGGLRPVARDMASTTTEIGLGRDASQAPPAGSSRSR